MNEDVEDYTDLIAERVVQFGGVAEGTARIAAKRSNLSEYSIAITAGHDHAAALSSALATFGKSVRHAIDVSDGFNDSDTADIFTEISRGVYK